MVRTQIQLPEEQVAMLKKMAAAQHKSMAEIIRQAIPHCRVHLLHEFVRYSAEFKAVFCMKGTGYRFSPV
ncbi:MAG: ribbon-helix-helix domain-containing protein [Deltaproteobacteria bacterium]|nr:ribbon-helix-helix domain-containing protein [Deltaproteobacteria bacterium]